MAVSLPNIGQLTVSSMNTMYSIMEANLRCLNLWQLDGRPMSGDIGRGATREAVAFAVHLATAKEKPHEETMNSNSIGSSDALIAGIAYGGYARKIVGRVLNSMQSQHGLACIEDYPEHLLVALVEALALVGNVKSYGTR